MTPRAPRGRGKATSRRAQATSGGDAARAAADAAHAGQRRALLDAARALLEAEGRAAVTVRRLANAVGTSTMAVYTAFGSKDALLEQLDAEGFEWLGRALEETEPHPDPLTRLARLLVAYREAALARPGWYARALAAGGDAAASVVRSSRARRVLAACVQACVDSGRLPARDVDGATDAVIAAVHGHVGLELAGYFSGATEAEERFVETLRVVVEGLAAS